MHGKDRCDRRGGDDRRRRRRARTRRTPATPCCWRRPGHPSTSSAATGIEAMRSPRPCAPCPGNRDEQHSDPIAAAQSGRRSQAGRVDGPRAAHPVRRLARQADDVVSPHHRRRCPAGDVGPDDGAVRFRACTPTTPTGRRGSSSRKQVLWTVVGLFAFYVALRMPVQLMRNVAFSGFAISDRPADPGADPGNRQGGQRFSRLVCRRGLFDAAVGAGQDRVPDLGRAPAGHPPLGAGVAARDVGAAGARGGHRAGAHRRPARPRADGFAGHHSAGPALVRRPAAAGVRVVAVRGRGVGGGAGHGRGLPLRPRDVVAEPERRLPGLRIPGPPGAIRPGQRGCIRRRAGAGQREVELLCPTRTTTSSSQSSARNSGSSAQRACCACSGCSPTPACGSPVARPIPSCGC